MVRFQGKMPIFKAKDENFFKRWSLEMAYVLGFLYADGYLQKNKRGSSYFCFTSTDKEIIEKIRNLLRSNHKISLRQRSKNNPEWKDSYVLQIGSKTMFDDLKKLGLTQNKSLILEFPNIPRRFLSDFIRGYFDGDGGVHFGKYWRKDRNKWKWEFTSRFTSGSKIFLTDLWTALKPYIEGGYLYEKNSGHELVFARHDSVALFNLMYNNVSSRMFLERKYNIFQRAFKILKLGT